MSRLRGEGGCPWDREQTYETIKSFLIEEAYEVVEAIEDKNLEALREELGDVLLQVVFLSQIAKEDGRFDIDGVIDSICDKMIRRHPHVFGDKKAADSREVLKNWEQMKQTERLQKQNGACNPEAPHPSILDGVTRRAPDVIEALQLSQRAARVGFDWPNSDKILAKLNEEIMELQAALEGSRSDDADEAQERKIEEEIGDILFVAVNLARHFKIDPESALRNTNRKFRDRFRHIEATLAKRSKSFDEVSLEEMERYWQEAKERETNRG